MKAKSSMLSSACEVRKLYLGKSIRKQIEFSTSRTHNVRFFNVYLLNPCSILDIEKQLEEDIYFSVYPHVENTICDLEYFRTRI